MNDAGRCKNYVWTEFGFYRCGKFDRHMSRCEARIEEQQHDAVTAIALLNRLEQSS